MGIIIAHIPLGTFKLVMALRVVVAIVALLCTSAFAARGPLPVVQDHASLMSDVIEAPDAPPHLHNPDELFFAGFVTGFLDYPSGNFGACLNDTTDGAMTIKNLFEELDEPITPTSARSILENINTAISLSKAWGPDCYGFKEHEWQAFKGLISKIESNPALVAALSVAYLYNHFPKVKQILEVAILGWENQDYYHMGYYVGLAEALVLESFEANMLPDL